MGLLSRYSEERAKKQLIDLTTTLVTNKLKQVAPELGGRLERKLTSSDRPRILVRVVPGVRALQVKTAKGDPFKYESSYLFETKATTTTIKLGGKIIGHVVTIPEKLFFTRDARGRLALSREGFQNLVEIMSHEVGAHITEKDQFARVRSEAESTLLKELRADVITTRLMKEFGLPRARINAYIRSRPMGLIARNIARKKEVEEARLKERMVKAREVRTKGWALGALEEAVGIKKAAKEGQARARRATVWGRRGVLD